MGMPMVMDVQQIKEAIPHRYPFLLVDRVIEMEEGKSITGLKNVTANEEFFNGHFPAKPIMPGVLQVEALAQVAGVLAIKSGAAGSMVYFMSIDGVKFRKPVVPGDQLVLKATVIQHRGKIWKFRGESFVDGTLVSEAEFMAMVSSEGV